jgi:hypothetical protein
MSRALVVLASLVCAAAAVAGPVRFLDESFKYDTDHPPAGFWLGNLDAGRGQETWAALTVEPAEGGGFSAKITIIAALSVDAPCSDFKADQGTVAFTVAGLQGSPRFEGRLSEDGQRFAGSITRSDGVGPGRFELARTPRPVDLPDPLVYQGALSGSFGRLDVAFVFARTPGGNWVGHVDIPMQGLNAFPFINVKRDEDRLTADLAVVPTPAAIDAHFSDDAKRLTGRFKQGPFDLELDLARAESYSPTIIRRPQEPVPPFPYSEEEVQIVSHAGHALAGTLTMPAGTGPFPAALLITGSGPQDRNETVFGHRPFLVLADYLARNGIAVLRCDDRGVGGSTGASAALTSVDLAADTRLALEFLASQPRIDRRHVGLIGHSEGGMIAPMVAAERQGVAYIVLLAGPGVRGDELLTVQLRKILEASGLSAEQVDPMCAQQKEVLDLMRSGMSEQELRDAVRPVIEAQLAATAGLGGAELAQAIEVNVGQAVSPWTRYFVSYDPRPVLGRVRCPVLALNGALDLQVWHEQNLPEIEKAVRAGGGDVTTRTYPGLNHLFQPATTGLIAEYATIEITFDESVMRDIVEWITSKTARAKPPGGAPGGGP